MADRRARDSAGRAAPPSRSSRRTYPTPPTTYPTTIEAEGGSGAYSFELTGGSLPAGLLLEVDGTVSGRPLESGSYTFEVTVTDDDTDVRAETLNLEVVRKKWLAYVADKVVTGRQDLYVVNTSNELLAETNLSTGVQSSAVIAGVAFAPAGRPALAFVTDKTTAGVLELHYVDLSGASPATPVKISGTEQVAAAEPTWSSDGRYIAYRDSEQNIYYSDVSSWRTHSCRPRRRRLPPALRRRFAADVHGRGVQ